jgi:hypothetical protein
MKKKEGKNIKSQVTIFIIIAIILVVLVALYFIYKNSSISQNKIPDDIVPIHEYVTNCVKEVGENSVSYIGYGGGYFIIPEFSTDNGLPFYYSDGKSYIPTIENIEKELGNYVDYMIGFCVSDFSEYPDFTIKQGTSKTKAVIGNNKVNFDVSYPLTITRGEKTFSLNNFEAEIPVRLDEIYDLAYKITQEQLLNGDDICISCIYDWGEEKDLFIEMNDYSNKSGIIVFTIRDEKLKILDRDYRFSFANKYNIA